MKKNIKNKNNNEKYKVIIIILSIVIVFLLVLIISLLSFYYKRLHIKKNAIYDVEDAKPLIYLYPEKDMNVSLKFKDEAKLTTTYPKYNNEWNVFAKKDGNLEVNGREYYGLYWEGKSKRKVDFKDGFVVKGEDSAKFLEEKLKILGLNERETNEFIIYWLPRLERNKYNLIHFMTTNEVEKEMPLEVSPKPDTKIRIIMEFKELNNKINIKEQKLVNQERKGFTLVEWGGSVINEGNIIYE